MAFVKYVYVLVSSDNDYYLEQLLLAVTSLRYHTPAAFVSLLVDGMTDATLTGTRALIRTLIDE